MKAINTNFSGGMILFLLSINWAAIILLTGFFLKYEVEPTTSIISTLSVGFILQLAFINDQLKKTKRLK
ncbi:MAG: hypothetical protein MK078_03735 [Crocinitomicaceae bacterium]|nr:hypothetical protein [Crocinitomicaceae bacterium]